MAKRGGRGRKFTFFGKFRTKKAARAKERKHPGSFILRRWTDGYSYFVIKPRKRK